MHAVRGGRCRSVPYDVFRFEEESTLRLDTLIFELLGLAAGGKKTGAAPPPRWLRRVRDWLHDSYHLPLTLADAAEDAGITPVHLSRAFRQHFGCTMGDYLRALRLEHARRGLAETEFSLSQVAIESGFYDQSHMTRALKQSFGATPGAYRRNISGVAAEDGLRQR